MDAERLSALNRLLDDGRPRSELELACIRRQLHDLQTGQERGLVWDATEAERAVRFFGLLTHWKGQWAGKSIRLEPWQEECIIRPLFGWRRPDGTRRFRQTYIELPRKNGKTTIAAGLALFGLCADREPGAEVYCAATKRDQARILFTDAKNLIRRSKLLRRMLTVHEHVLKFPHLGGKLLPLSSEGNSLDGLNMHFGVIDELHAHRTREVHDVLTTSVGSRLQPMVASITTAGHDRSSVCWEQHQYAAAVLLQPGYEDDSFFTFIACSEVGDDPFDPQTWRKANPNLGVSKSFEYMEEQSRRAKHSTAFLNTFRRLELGQWTEQAVRWLNMAAWDECKGPLPDFRGRACFDGLDLGNVRDTNALVLVSRMGDRFALKPYFWIPEASLNEKAHADRRQLLYWAEKGEIRKTPGNVTDYGFIARDVMQIFREHNLEELAYDPWGPASAFVQTLQELGFPYSKLVEFRQNISHYAAPTKEFDRLVASRKILHDGNSVLRWMASNAVVRQDSAGNMMPDKERSSTKIDGISASVMGLGRAMLSPTPQAPMAARGYAAKF